MTARDGISGATSSVITSTGGRSVVRDTSLGQPIFAVELVFTRVAVMSNSSRVSNILPDVLRRTIRWVRHMTWKIRRIRMSSSITVFLVRLLF